MTIEVKKTKTISKRTIVIINRSKLLCIVCVHFFSRPVAGFSPLLIICFRVASFANVCLSFCHAMLNANSRTFWSKMVRCRQHRLMWRPKWDFTMILSGFGDFRICVPVPGGGGGGMFWMGSDPQSAPIHGGVGGGVSGKVRSTIHGVPSPCCCQLRTNTFESTP